MKLTPMMMPQLERAAKSTPLHKASLPGVSMDTIPETGQFFSTRPFLGINTIDAADGSMVVVAALHIEAHKHSSTVV